LRQANSVEDFGAVLVRHILSEAAAGRGKLRDDQTIEVDLTAKMTLPAFEDTALARRGCCDMCITSFGHEVVCVKVCTY
jgi:hypothetical protein